MTDRTAKSTANARHLEALSTKDRLYTPRTPFLVYISSLFLNRVKKNPPRKEDHE